jgi:hypothetical protein
MITEELRSKILEALQKSRENFYGSDAKFSVSMGINNAQYSRIKRGDVDKVISEAQWISLARRLGVSLQDAPVWNTANTDVYRFITAQLEACQTRSLSSLLCDLSDIGKTYTAKRYCEGHRNAVYVDCSQNKTKSGLIRCIAKQFGVGHTGLYSDVYGDLVFYLKTIPTPLIILDEAGDLSGEAFLELKALWNATELACGWYMMGADGLQKKIRMGIDMKRVGFTELFSRFGRRYGHVLPEVHDEAARQQMAAAAMIVRTNRPDADVNGIIRRSIGDDGMPSLRRIYKELQKIELQ